MRHAFIAALALSCAAVFSEDSGASEFEKYCNLPDFAQPTRQTIVVLDEMNAFAESGKAPSARNQPWRNFIGSLLFVDPATLQHYFEPRERVTIVIARKDGAGVRTVFSGCVPVFSLAEQRSLEKRAGFMHSVNTFFGTGLMGEAKKDMDLFRIRIGDGFRDALRPSALSKSDEGMEDTSDVAKSGTFASLRQGDFVNLAYGVPRIVFLSDIGHHFASGGTRSEARRLGLAKAAAVGLNLKGAEVYVVGMSGGAVVTDALTTFFLASHSELVSSSAAASMPTFLPPPVTVLRYQGNIQYPGGVFPIRIRLAADQNGTLVNSWVSVEINGEQFSPLHGVLTCTDNGRCRYTGDDVFAQVWNYTNVGPNSQPVLNASMPFGGARSFNLTIHGDEASGWISDSQIRFEGTKDNKLGFSAHRQSSAQF